jgi:hypothetical protein
MVSLLCSFWAIERQNIIVEGYDRAYLTVVRKQKETERSLGEDKSFKGTLPVCHQD